MTTRTRIMLLFVVSGCSATAAEPAVHPEAPTSAAAPDPMTPDEMQRALVVPAGPSAAASTGAPLAAESDGAAPAGFGAAAPRQPTPREPLAFLADRWLPDTASLELRKAAPVMSAPTADAEEIGVVARGTRVLWRGAAEGVGCDQPWIEIEPRGWVCAPVDPSNRGASTEILPRLGNKATPGVSGLIRRAAIVYPDKESAIAGVGRIPVGETVGLSGTTTIDGKRFWKTRSGEYVEARHVIRFWGSDFRGVELGAKTGLSLPLAFAHSSGSKGKAPVAVRDRPSARGRSVRKLDRREPVSVLETSPDGRWVRIGDAQWVSRKEVRIATATEPPSERIGTERWIDIDLDEQVIVAYDGRTPIYASLVSSGKWKHATPTGVFRVSAKKAVTTMNSTATSKEVYSVANVPWVMYFHEAYALHGAYWHNGFGRQRSHGCVNLSPRDARWLYSFIGPDIPAGWSSVEGNTDRPGSAVRIRSRRDPQPRFRSLAAKVEPDRARIASAD